MNRHCIHKVNQGKLRKTKISQCEQRLTKVKHIAKSLSNISLATLGSAISGLAISGLATSELAKSGLATSGLETSGLTL